ncbi:MAG: hypothetical protein ACTSUE_10525 [Promethearchaeota archaeon]
MMFTQQRHQPLRRIVFSATPPPPPPPPAPRVTETLFVPVPVPVFMPTRVVRPARVRSAIPLKKRTVVMPQRRQQRRAPVHVPLPPPHRMVQQAPRFSLVPPQYHGPGRTGPPQRRSTKLLDNAPNTILGKRRRKRPSRKQKDPRGKKKRVKYSAPEPAAAIQRPRSRPPPMVVDAPNPFKRNLAVLLQ